MFMKLVSTLVLFILFIPVFAEEDANIAGLDPKQLKNEFLKQKEAATKGDTRAQYALGFMYLQGEGIAQDAKIAFKWIELAARSGLPEAQDTLAYLYNNGLGVEQNTLSAYIWYSVAAANGIFLANRVKDNLGKELSPDQHEQAQVVLKEYLQNYLKND